MFAFVLSIIFIASFAKSQFRTSYKVRISRYVSLVVTVSGHHRLRQKPGGRAHTDKGLMLLRADVKRAVTDSLLNAAFNMSKQKPLYCSTQHSRYTGWGMLASMGSKVQCQWKAVLWSSILSKLPQN